MSGEDAKAIMWLGLALCFAVGGFGLGYALWRLGRVLRGAEQELHRTVDGVVPLMAKAGVSMDRVNDQLGKVDVMMDSAVDITESLDTTVRTVSHAITEPVKAVSSTVAGAAEAARSFRERMAAGDDAEAGASSVAVTDPLDEDPFDDPLDADPVPETPAAADRIVTRITDDRDGTPT